MTTLDEALRALEKDCREYARVSAKAHMPGTEKDFREIADRIAALLSSRQEVAPVAWMEPVTFNTFSAADFAEVLRRWPDDYDDWFPVYREPTGQTSDARGGE